MAEDYMYSSAVDYAGEKGLFGCYCSKISLGTDCKSAAAEEGLQDH